MVPTIVPVIRDARNHRPTAIRRNAAEIFCAATLRSLLIERHPAAPITSLNASHVLLRPGTDQLPSAHSRWILRIYSVKRFHVVRRTVSSAAANRFQLSSSVPSARLPAAVIR